jgi:Ni,Fe-hydrogenase III small subunit/formate hydrogenlyase subunit 6/NADH:ubiquinone oxidoreductase subunit I
MYNLTKTRLQQGHRTIPFPAEEPVLPERFRGLPRLPNTPCPADCRACADACPLQCLTRPAIENRNSKFEISLDLGQCVFCGDCARACPHGRLSFSNDYRLATRRREQLVLTGSELQLADKLAADLLKLFGRSLKLRQVSAGGCNGCEVDVNVLGVPTFDLGRFGIQMVASPRHADGLLVTGPVTQNMRSALLKTYDALPAPKLVIACGACAVSGGPFRGHSEACDGVVKLLPVDLFIPGCPPHPITILDALLRLLGKR